jgi:hypothetical protein
VGKKRFWEVAIIETGAPQPNTLLNIAHLLIDAPTAGCGRGFLTRVGTTIPDFRAWLAPQAVRTDRDFRTTARRSSVRNSRQFPQPREQFGSLGPAQAEHPSTG